VAELKGDFQARRLSLVEDGVVSFWLSGGEGNNEKRYDSNQRFMVH
jgi:hypothetical protein